MKWTAAILKYKIQTQRNTEYLKCRSAACGTVLRQKAYAGIRKRGRRNEGI